MTLNPRFLYGDIDLTDAPYMVRFGSDFSSPETIYEILSSMLEDGDLMVARRRGNRAQLRIPILIEEADLAANSSAANAIELEADKFRSTLSIDPGDGFGAVTVFETFAGNFVYTHDDDAESQGFRLYELVIPALPYTRSETQTTIGSAFVSNSETIYDNCESTTGWSVYGYQTATITVDSTAGNFSTGTGSVKFEILPEVYIDHAPFVQPSGGASMPVKISKTGLSIDASGGGYFMFRVKTSDARQSIQTSSAVFYLTSSGGGRQAATLVSETTLDDGFTKYALLVPDESTITAFEFEGIIFGEGFEYGSKPPNPDLWFDSIGLASGATENQAARTLTIGGSARSEGSFQVSSAVGLGDVLLYTCPDLDDGFRPDLRRFTSAGTPTSDAAAINGSYIPANTGEFEAPANIFRSGAYAVLARIRSTATLTPTLSIDAKTVLSGTVIGETYTVDSGAMTVADMTNYHVVRIGVIDLPPHKVASAADAVVRFELNGASTIRVDEVMVFPLEDAALTWIECGSGAPSASVASRVWIDGPSSSLPLGQILVGNNEDRSDARYIRPKSKGKHLLYPGQNLAYLLTSAAGGADMATTYFKHWHTWAAE